MKYNFLWERSQLGTYVKIKGVNKKKLKKMENAMEEGAASRRRRTGY